MATAYTEETNTAKFQTTNWVGNRWARSGSALLKILLWALFSLFLSFGVLWVE